MTGSCSACLAADFQPLPGLVTTPKHKPTGQRSRACGHVRIPTFVPRTMADVAPLEGVQINEEALPEGATPAEKAEFVRRLTAKHPQRRLALSACDGGHVDLRGVALPDATLHLADLPGADLRDADLRGASLGKANLRGAQLRGVDLRGATLTGCNLTEARIGQARLQGVDLAGCTLTHAHLSGVWFAKTELRRDQLGDAIGEGL